MRLAWAPLAIADRETIFDHLAAHDPRVAILVDERIASVATILLRFPEIGRLGRVEGTREFIIAKTPYLAAYTVEFGTITVLRVLHGAQLWPDGLLG